MTRKWFSRYGWWWVPVLIILFAGCTDLGEDSEPKVGKVNFTLDVKELQQSLGNARTQWEAKPHKVRKLRMELKAYPRAIESRVTYDFYGNKEFSIDPVILPVGDYEIEKFELTDETGEILYLCPTEEADSAILEIVDHVLPVSFKVSEENSPPLFIEVIPRYDLPLKTYGYSDITAGIMELVSFTLGVRPQHPTSSGNGLYDLEIEWLDNGAAIFSKDSISFGIERFLFGVRTEDREPQDWMIRLRVRAKGYAEQSFSCNLGHINEFNYPHSNNSVNIILNNEVKHVYSGSGRFINELMLNKEGAEILEDYEFTHIYMDEPFFYYGENFGDDALRSLVYLDELVLLGPGKVSGFNGLKEVEKIIIVDIESLTGFDALERIGSGELEFQNPQIKELGGFGSLKTINRIYISSCYSLRIIDGFQKLERVEEQIYISDNSSLEEIQGFKNLRKIHTLIISHNDALHSISGFSEHIFFGKTLWLSWCPNLASACPFSACFRQPYNADFDTTDPYNFLVLGLKDGLSYTFEEFKKVECE